MHTSDPQAGSSELVIIDTQRLRLAGIARLLEGWASAMGLTVKPVVPDVSPDANNISANCEMIIISIGNASIEDVQHRTLIGDVRRLMPPYAPLVIISDREEPQEISAAFQEGAIGFVPTSIEPALAFQALSFIRSGGSFFPPSVLSSLLGEVPLRSSVQINSDLTIKQEEVFDLLRQGCSNKSIARQLGMSEATVKAHARQLMHKFGVTNRTQLAVVAMNGSAPAADLMRSK
jgi:DNA-binding NarL/FixJ family response regulator